jgi:hypothetical protein
MLQLLLWGDASLLAQKQSAATQLQGVVGSHMPPSPPREQRPTLQSTHQTTSDGGRQMGMTYNLDNTYLWYDQGWLSAPLCP